MNKPDEELLDVLREIRDQLRAGHEQASARHSEQMDEWRGDKEKWEKRQRHREWVTTIALIIALGAVVIGGLAILAWRVL